MAPVGTGPRVRAPKFVRGDWLNVAAPLTLDALRGRFVLLDFWTSCCGNCLHVLDELRPVETSHADVLTVVGIHSPKFPHEAQLDAVRAAVERYGIHHPVVNDPGLELWRQYAVCAWPTLVLVDPEGYVVAQAAGEGQVGALIAVLDDLLPGYVSRGVLHRGTVPSEPADHADTPLRFPAKAILLPAARTGQPHDSLLIADAGHHQVVETTLDGGTVLRRTGTSVRARPFAEPNGVALLPPGLVDYDVLVADTANHVLRGLRLGDGALVTTIDLPALLQDARTVTGAVPAVLSPWDAVWWPALDRVVVAAAGVHLLLTVDPRSGGAEILAGTTVEGLRDGPALDAWLAQPSGLAVDGDRLWFVDAETSALRYLTVETSGGSGGGNCTVHTAVGEGLFDFGHVDGPAATARFQHPLGVTVLPDATVAVLDTYNGAVRRYDPATQTVSTVARDLGEPSGAVVVDGALLVVESAEHRLTRVDLDDADVVHGPAEHTEREPVDLAPGAVSLQVAFTAPPGRTLDDRYGPATRLSVTASPPELLVAGAGDSTELHRPVELAADIAGGVLHVTAQAASCDDDGAQHPACYLARQDWGIPIRVVADGARELRLMLLD